MSIEEIDRKELEELAEAEASVVVPAALIVALIVKIEGLEEKIASYESNSRNSSKPPSSDRHGPNKPDKKPRKGGGRRKPGGQKGHRGKTLEQVADPDHVITHRLKGSCEHCGTSLGGVEAGGL